MRNPCSYCVLQPKCSIKCIEKFKYLKQVDMIIFMIIFIFITITNLLIMKYIMPYLYNMMGSWILIIFSILCFYQTIGIRAFFEFLKTLHKYRKKIWT